MNHPDIDFYILQERRKDELAAAAHSRLVKEALQAQSYSPGQHRMMFVAGMLSKVLSWLGNLLMNWGCSLQSRYASELNLNPCAEP